MNFFQADINEYELSDEYDIIFSSGVFHYLTPNRREIFIHNLKEHTTMHGIHALNVFVAKPFIEAAPDSEEA
ncbi:XRE family transcriptional regulator, partial [Klebsiella oxytoca]